MQWGVGSVEIVEKDNAQITQDTKYVWEGAEILESRAADGGTTLQKYFGQGFVDSDGTDLFYTRDHLGSVRELVDMQGAVRARYDYDPYGRMTKISGDRDSVFGYTGHFWHGQSGLFLTLFRAYDPNLGRWISRDPIEEDGGKNLYQYVFSNPINSVDFLGDKPYYVFVWGPSFPYIAGNGGVGHVMVVDPSDRRVVSSQFPTPHGAVGDNTTKSFWETFEAEGDETPDVFQVDLPNDAAAEAAAKSEANKTFWYASPRQKDKNSTNCTVASINILKAGGLKGVDQYWFYTPVSMKRNLGNLAKTPGSGVTQLDYTNVMTTMGW